MGAFVLFKKDGIMNKSRKVYGEVRERFNRTVLKTVVPLRGPWARPAPISVSLDEANNDYGSVPEWSNGAVLKTAKGESSSEVRILSLPPKLSNLKLVRGENLYPVGSQSDSYGATLSANFHFL